MRALVAVPALAAALVGVVGPARAQAGTPVLQARASSARDATQRGLVVSLRDGGRRYVQVARTASVRTTLAQLRARPGVRWVRSRVVAHAAAVEPYVPNDPGESGIAAGWQQLQWNFLSGVGVDAPRAWANLRAVGHPGGRGVIIAALDTGAAYANRDGLERSPDFRPAQFVKGYDFCAHDGTTLACSGRDQYPEDRNGHGTHVAGTLAEATDNGVGLTGLAYGARIMPVKVLNSDGAGDESSIASGIRFAATHGADIINMSLEFDADVLADEIPDILDALSYARRQGVLVIGASGNEGRTAVAYPARASSVLSVGATTEHGCVSDYSNQGTRLDLVAPGGGKDAAVPAGGLCQPQPKAGRDIFQETYRGRHNRAFGFPTDYEGTSMAAPAVSATAALVIASGVLGPNPTPDALKARLKATARDLGPPGVDEQYGAGLIDAGAATDPTVPVIATP
ncbi:MAG: serine protease [Baekduia sp.]|nr:serine protease [Baekduia sp.]